MEYNSVMNQVSDEQDEIPKEWHVYLLRCADDSLYTGITNDLLRRVEQHNAGVAARYTRARRPVVLVYQEPAENRSSALKREYAIKQLTRSQKQDLIANKHE